METDSTVLTTARLPSGVTNVSPTFRLSAGTHVPLTQKRVSWLATISLAEDATTDDRIRHAKASTIVVFIHADRNR